MPSPLPTVVPSFLKPALLQASPEMTRLVADYDWSSTALGPVEQWSPALRNAVDGMLATGSALLLWWGPTFVQIYNDAYRPVLGDKHPKALGQPVSECWNEIIDTIGPLIETPFHGGPPSVLEDLDVTLQRRGYAEEAHFTVAYSPVFDDTTLTGIGGVMATVYETTERVIGDRRMRLLRSLATRTIEAADPAGVCEAAAEVLCTDPHDIPYAALYLFDESGRTAHLTSISGSLRSAQSPWPKTVVSSELRTEPSEVVLPIRSTQSAPWGFVVAGTSHRLPLDEKYVDFLDMVVAPISTALDKVHAYAAERERAEALAELDRAKTAFFSNVSHEFRTPLTLILGPLEELSKCTSGTQKSLAGAAHRNALRLLKLVNTLLEFSRLESGSNDAVFVETDLAALTVDLCSVFRSAVEDAGLTFEVDVRLEHTAFVDRSMWEKIVLNLLSNALKFTMRGGIRVTLEESAGFAELKVHDTGVGIDPRDRGKIFERFQRSRPSEARSHEGSGIGLALVNELIRLHGGSVSVESALGDGSTFRVRIPLGTDHLPAHLVRSVGADGDATTIAQYLADIEGISGTPDAAQIIAAGARARVLLVDDNRDLRRYISHLLSGRYDLVAAGDGRQALELLKTETFDLVLTDVMMPRMDGAELLAAMRADSELASIPVIMLSARAGEESSTEMLRGGAVDYLVKPFSAEQLLARIDAQLESRKQWYDRISEDTGGQMQFRAFANALPIIVWQRDQAGAVTFTNAQWHRVLNMPYHTSSYGEEARRSIVHPDDYDGAFETIAEAIKSRTPYETEYRLKPVGGDDASYRWYLTRGVTQFDADGVFQGWTGWTIDVHEPHLREEMERRLARAAQQSERDFRDLAESIPVMLWISDSTGARKWYNAQWYEFTGQTPEEALDWGWQSVHPARDLQRIMKRLPECVADGERFVMKASLKRADGEFREMLMRAVPVRDAAGKVIRWYGCATDIQYQQDALDRTRHVADVLKDILLPNELPSDERLHVDGIYQSPSEEELVGGDWFDAMRLPDGRMLISIGDVTGHGLEASVLAARLRHAMIDYSLGSADPSEVLESVNRVMRAQYPDRFATAVLGFIDPTHSQLTYACAGHYPPVIAHEGAPAMQLPYGGLPLGVQDLVLSVKHVTGIPPRAVMAFYTDGIVEFENDMPLAEERLKIAVSGLVNKNVSKPAEAVRDAVMMGAPSRDDAALLVLRFTDKPAAEAADERTRVMSWRFHSSDAQTVGRSRGVIMRFLEQFSDDREELFGAELVIGEALSNTFRHAPGIVEVEVDCRGQRAVVVLTDTGPGIGRITRRLPADDLEESGRGLFIAQALAHDVSAQPVAGGTRLRIVLNVTLTAHQPTDSPSLPKSDPPL